MNKIRGFLKHKRDGVSAFNRAIYFLPFLVFVFISLILGAVIFVGSELRVYALPSGALGTPVLTTSVSFSSLDFQFSGTEAAASEFKHYPISYTVTTNNKTGYKSYISSISENTSLNNTDVSVLTRFNSIDTPKISSDFAPKNWGYQIKNSVGYNPSQPYRPIPKQSMPKEIYSTNVSGTTVGAATTHVVGVDFGVKAGPDLAPGLYTNSIVFTTITNYVPTEATFLSGPEFNNIVANLDSTHNVNVFKRSNVPPANIGAAAKVSTSDSERPIYAWFNAPDRTIYWWTDADTAYVNSNANQMFEDFNRGVADMDLIDIRGMDTSKTLTMHNFFCDGAKSVKNYNIDGINTSKVWDFSGMFAGSDQLGTAKTPIDFSKLDTGSAIDMSNMFQRSNFTSIDVRSFNTKNVKYMGCMFCGVIKAKNIDLHGWDVSSLLGANLMFASTQIEHINLANWNSHALLDTSRMFEGTVTLQSLDITGIDTSKVKNMFGMFYLSALPNLDLTQLNTSSVTNMNSMFKQMSRISSLNFTSFNTSNVTDFGEMFRGIVVGSRTLDVRSFNTSKATAMWMMFDGTNLIGNLDLSSFDTSHVGDMSNMFSNSVFLNSVNVSSFNTSAVVNMQGMFYRTLGMPVINIANFNTANVQNMQDMFRETGAVTIKASALFNTNNIVDSSRMFMNAIHLVGGNGTSYNVSFPQDKTYARQDVVGLPGYFTF